MRRGMDENCRKSVIGETLDGRLLPTKQQSQILLNVNNAKIQTRENWSEHFSWIAEKLEEFDRSMRPRIKELNADDYIQ